MCPKFTERAGEMMNLQTGDVIAYANDDNTLVIVWNGSATFNVFMDSTEVDVFTQYDVATVSEAVAAAQSHIDDAATGLDEVLG